jgi:hypothetical protein
MIQMSSYRSVALIYSALTLISGCGTSRDVEPKSSDESALRSDQRTDNKDKTDAADSKGSPRLKMALSDFKPPASLKLLDGTSVDLRPAGEQKVTLLYLWATYTPSTIDDIGTLESLVARRSGKGVRLVTVDCADSREEVRQFLAENKLNIPVAVNSEQSANARLRVSSVPALYVIDSQGIGSRSRIGPLENVDIEGAIAETATK